MELKEVTKATQTTSSIKGVTHNGNGNQFVGSFGNDSVPATNMNISDVEHNGAGDQVVGRFVGKIPPGTTQFVGVNWEKVDPHMYREICLG